MDMNKTLKITAIVGIVFMAFSVSYYFLLLLPAQNATTALENNRTQCSIQAQKAFENIEATYGPSSGKSFFKQENHFNPFMDKCFALITFLGYGYSGNILIDADEMTLIAGDNWSGFDPFGVAPVTQPTFNPAQFGATPVSNSQNQQQNNQSNPFSLGNQTSTQTTPTDQSNNSSDANPFPLLDGNYTIGPDMDTSSTYQQVMDFENEAMGSTTSTTQEFPYGDYK